MDISMYMLETETDACKVECCINDIPACVVSPDSGRFDARTINQLVQPNENRISVTVFPGPTPSRVRETSTIPASPSAGFTVRLKTYPRGALPGDKGIVTLEEIIWKSPKPGAPAKVPIVVERLIALPKVLPDWAWHRWPILTLNQDTVARVQSLLKDLALSLNRRDPEPFISVAGPRFADVASAFGHDIATLKRVFREDLREVSSISEWLFPAPEPSAMDFRLCGQGRLIDCIAADWLPILRSGKDKYGAIMKRYPARIGFQDGNLRIVR